VVDQDHWVRIVSPKVHRPGQGERGPTGAGERNRRAGVSLGPLNSGFRAPSSAGTAALDTCVRAPNSAQLLIWLSAAPLRVPGEGE
jgi:hypothetical protein